MQNTLKRYSNEQLAAMADKISIVDYIEQTEELHRRGNNYFCCCPFHDNDDTPSLCIYPDENKWYCFGCGAGSSIYDWIMRKDGISFQEAIKKVSSLTNSPLEEYTESESIAVLKELKRSHQKPPEIIRPILDWHLDYIDKYSDELPQEWIDEGMTEEALKTYNIRIDHNKNRIVYPVLDQDNNLIGVKGRTRLSTYKELGLSKYMNYYKVGSLDYFAGWDKSYTEIINTKSVIIFEGIKSCIKAWGWGIRNTAASETSKLSDGQLKLLIKTGLSEVIIGWDTDQKLIDIINNEKIKMLQKFTQVSIIYDKYNLLGEKASPADCGKDVFLKLYSSRIKL